MVAVGGFTGLRPRNLRELTLGETILRRPSYWEVAIRAGRTKTGKRDLVGVIPGPLTQPLDAYIARFRLLIGPAAPDSGPLWLSGRGRELCKAMMGKAFERAGTLAGTKLRPHATRHMMATTMLRYDPGSIHLASAALGHTDEEMVALHYGRAWDQGAIDAWRKIRALYDGTVDGKARHRR